MNVDIVQGDVVVAATIIKAGGAGAAGFNAAIGKCHLSVAVIARDAKGAVALGGDGELVDVDFTAANLQAVGPSARGGNPQVGARDIAARNQPVAKKTQTIRVITVDSNLQVVEQESGAATSGVLVDHDSISI